jgi:hypothetical protein
MRNRKQTSKTYGKDSYRVGEKGSARTFKLR